MNDVLDILMDPDCDLWSKTDSDDDEMTLAIIPPLEKACVDSDRDSEGAFTAVYSTFFFQRDLGLFY